MTNEEAIKIIDKGLDIGDQMPFLTVDQMNEAKQMAIKALSQQTEYHGTKDMEGLYYCPICQQTTTVVKDGKCPKCGATMDELSTSYLTDETREVLETIDGKVGDMPPVTPKQRTGHWIHKNDDHYDWFECSECGHGDNGEVDYGQGSTYCPVCGCKMEDKT
jgi:uncharacterized paraquat-inducible protein A